ALRFAIATAGSLIFPFAPHCGADVYERLTGGRVWEESWPAADAALLESATGSRPPRRRRRTSSRRSAATSPTCARTSTATRSSRRSSCRASSSTSSCTEAGRVAPPYVAVVGSGFAAPEVL